PHSPRLGLSSCSAPLLALPPFPTRRSSDLFALAATDDIIAPHQRARSRKRKRRHTHKGANHDPHHPAPRFSETHRRRGGADRPLDRKSTRLNSSHQITSYAVFCSKKKQNPS